MFWYIATSYVYAYTRIHVRLKSKVLYMYTSLGDVTWINQRTSEVCQPSFTHSSNDASGKLGYILKNKDLANPNYRVIQSTFAHYY